jgi:hypothetical protein
LILGNKTWGGLTMSGEFKESYIEKCVKGRREVEYLRIFKQFGPEPIIPSALKAGDFFYYEWMGESCVNKVRSIDHASVFSEDGRTYPKDDCAWIPTRDQLIQGLEAIHWAIGDTSQLDEQGILEEYMGTHEKKTWKRDKRVWQKTE